MKEQIKKRLPKNVLQGIYYLHKYGLIAFLKRTFLGIDLDAPGNSRKTAISYHKWRLERLPDKEQLAAQRRETFSYAPKISIVVPLYRTPGKFLREMIDSVRAQTYGNWELCLANGDPSCKEVGKILEKYTAKDARIRVCDLEENLGIAGNTNAALAMAEGIFVGLLDHDDLLEPDACYEIVKRLQESPETDVFYTDEDKVSMNGSRYFEPNFKPDFNIDLLRGNNYICHFFVVRRSLLEQTGGFRKEFDGAQDHDLILRCTELAGKICHIPRALYHWRVHAQSTAQNPESKQYAFEAGKRAVEAHLKRTGVKGTVSLTDNFGFYSVRYPVEGTPLVSILIPNKDEADTLRSCLTSIFEKTTYENYEIIIIENNSTEAETFAYYKELEKEARVQVVYWKDGFNYSALNNFGFSFAKGDYILCLNNDITVITPDWLQLFLGQCQRKEVGIVGARLYYPDDTIQHGGVIVGIGGVAGALFVGMDRKRLGYLRKERQQQDLSAVTAACMMVDRNAWEAAGGFEEKLAVAFNDIDFCLKVREQGFLVVYEPNVEMYHYESKSRGYEDTKEKQARFAGEVAFMQKRWARILKEGDPYYNPNFSLEQCDYSLKETVK